jgi:two-component system OmpR family response regulator
MAGSIHPLTVLIVDDHPDTAESLAAVIRKCGHDPHTAYTPTEAVQATDADPPDVILMDIGIPGLDGYTLARKLCNRLTRKPLLVAVTGLPDLEDRSKQEGFDHHFAKPVNPADLVVLLYAYAKRLAGGSTPNP